ncbi:MAG: hypothetical protein MJY94_05280 [Bacteroidales bacterium]|nr:hypothetical protein [Bacteroidales bacterium]
MNRFIRFIISVACLNCLSAGIASAQAQISTKKVLIGDFPSKVTKVVTGGNTMLDDLLKQEVSARWRVSPYEFCTLEEYQQLKEDPSYYFLMFAYDTDLRGRRNGVTVINLSKGGVAKQAKGSKSAKAINICDFPIASTQFPDGRESVWMAAAVDIIQDFAIKSTESDFAGYRGLAAMSSPWKCRNSHIIFSEDDLSRALADDIRNKYFDDKIEIMEDADELISDGRQDALVSFVVSPTDAYSGNPCYKMLINARTHELCYFERSKISTRNPEGFGNTDIKKIGVIRKSVRK